MRSLTVLKVASVAMLLAACGGGPAPRTVASYSPLYRTTDITTAGGGRDTFVVLRGNPLAMDPAQFERLVLDSMQGRNWGQRTNFTTRPTNYDPGFKVVMLFNGPATTGGPLCANPGAFTGRTGPATELHLYAVFCRYDDAVSQVEGWLSGDARGVQRDAFAALISQITRDLFPPYNPDDARRDSERRGSRRVP